MYFKKSSFVLCCCILMAGIILARAGQPINLLQNGDFSQELLPLWQSLVTDSEEGRITRSQSEGYKGSGIVIENFRPVETRVRQGMNRVIKVDPGSQVLLTGWVKTALEKDGCAELQIYYMNQDGKVLAAPHSIPARGKSNWKRVIVDGEVPCETAYLMVDLKIHSGRGRAVFSDLSLSVHRAPLTLADHPQIVLLTDLPEYHQTVKHLEVLFANSITTVAAGEDCAKSLADANGAIVLYDNAMPDNLVAEIKKFATRGCRVFMDIRNFATGWQRQATEITIGKPVEISQPLRSETNYVRCAASDRAFNQSVRERMQAGLKVVKVGDSNAGFSTGQIMPRVCWSSGKLMVLPQDFKLEGMEVLAVGPGGEPGLVELNIGKGKITACDLLSLREPFEGYIDSFYAYTPVSGALGNPPVLGEYFEKKFTYEELEAEMHRIAAEYSNVIQIKEEGIGTGDYKLWSLNMGKQGASLYFIYAMVHGSEWEPSHGLLSFAKGIAQGKLDDVIDLNKVRIKIMPVVNPWGYARMLRQNANGIDLNRQGDFMWKEYVGRDTNKDGKYGPKDTNWKGDAPFSEPETKIYKAIIDDPDLLCVLDFHGTLKEVSNKVAIAPVTAAPDNHLRMLDMQTRVNHRLWGRHLLRQNLENIPSQYNLKRVWNRGDTMPSLPNTAARNKYGMLIEIRTCYSDTYGTLLQTDITCELCRTLFISYPPELATR